MSEYSVADSRKFVSHVSGKAESKTGEEKSAKRLKCQSYLPIYLQRNSLQHYEAKRPHASTLSAALVEFPGIEANTM
jgi:hypothetical protein